MNNFTSELVFYVFAALGILTALLVVIKANPVGSAVCMAISFACAAVIMFQLDAQFLGIIQILVYTGAIMVLMLFIIMLLDVENEKKVLSRPLPLIAGLVVACCFIAQLAGVVGTIPGADSSRPTLCSQGIPFDDFTIGTTEGEYIFDSSIMTPDPIDFKGGVTNYGSIKPVFFNETQPPVGHSPAVRLPKIDPSQTAYPEGSNLAKTIESGTFPDTALLGHRLFAQYHIELIIAGLALLAATVGSVVLTRRPRNN